MGRILKRRVAALALAIGLVAGGAIAAVAATGSGSSAPSASALHGGQFLKTAADYLGISRGQLQGKLRSGQTLAQIASAEGKPAAPLMQQLGQSASAQVEQRLRATAARTGNAKHGHRLRHSLRAAAAKYLGLTPSALAQQLRAGATLAQIADRTAARSSSGLIEALVQARQQMSSESGSAKKGGKATSAAQLAKIRQRITAFVNKSHVAKQRTAGGTKPAKHAKGKS